VGGPGDPVPHDDERFVLRRGVQAEDVFFTYAFTPIREDDGRVVGALNILNESTERMRLAFQRERALAWLATIPQENPDPVLRLARDGTVLYMNTSARISFAGELEIGSSAPQALLAAANQAFASGMVQQVELKRRDKWFWFTARAVADEANIYGRDITERRLAEEQLRESEERYRKLVEMFPDAVIVHQDRCVVFVNPAAVRLFGASKAEALLGIDMVELVQPEQRAIARERIHIAQAGPQTPWLEMRMRRLDGHEVFCEVSGTGIEYRRAPAVQVVIREITERQKAEEAARQSEQALHESEERLRAHMNNSPLAVIEFDSQFRITRWSKQAERIFGWDANEALGQSIGEMHWVHEEDLEEVAGEAGGLLTGERPSSLHVNRNYRKDGSLVYCEWYNSALYGPDGSLVSVLSQVLDISDRKRTEQALLEAKERLEEADRQKNQFLAMLSHELRNPLAPIRNSLYVLDHAVPGGEQAKRAQAIIGRQVGHMIRLIDDLLDVTRIVRGKIQLQAERLDLNELAHSTIEDHRSVFVESDVELTLRPAAVPVWVRGDRIRLAQIIGNLLQNAAKFTAHGGTTTVAIRVDETQGHAILSVGDTGRGIEPEIIPRLFEPFAQADTTLDRSKGGLGLGLALVKGLVEQHGGSVEARSAGPGRGSEFLVRLPLDRTKSVTVECRRASVDRARRRVLVIENNVDAAESLREVLELDGHEVVVAYDGPGGIAKAREFRPDVVLCDIGLPGMDGYQVARAFRSDEALRENYLVALSGYALPEDLQRAQDAGFDRHLAKPPSLEKLESVLGAIRK